MTWTASVPLKGHEVAGRGLHVMALLQGIKKLFGPLLDDLACVSDVKEAMELRKRPECDGPASREQEAVRSSAI
jgi:hypothetical protein